MKLSSVKKKMTNVRWTVVALIFFATTINYIDRQVIGLLKYFVMTCEALLTAAVTKAPTTGTVLPAPSSRACSYCR